MATKRAIVDLLTRDELKQLVDTYELKVEDRRKLDELQSAAKRLHRTDLGLFLTLLDRDRLKAICRNLDLDDGGKIKAEIVARILGNNSDDNASDIPLGSSIQESEPARKPRLFIGSTVEALSVAREVQAELEHEAETTIWSQDLFTAGASTWSELVEKSRRFDFALIVFSGDDKIISRGDSSSAPRDNVLLEYGLFVGVLGAARTFFLFDRNHKPKIATDLAGVTALTYDGERTDRNLQAAVGPACTRLRKLFKEHGNREPRSQEV